jgi:translocator protein
LWKVAIKMSQRNVDTRSRSGSRILALAFWLIVVAAVALAGSWLTLPKIPTWYATLNKPWFTPPNALFGPVWSVLYVMMAVAVWRVGGHQAGTDRARAIAIFVLQLAFNALWSPVFFGLESPQLALAVIVAMLLSLALTLVLFWRLDRVAGALLIPYFLWVCYATAVNLGVVILN